ncbi:MAG: adenylate synthase [Rhodoferax sp.]|uniref:F390 synthetase-related protein n=1 Tax=Rhodoferax sp. TaxID=50421 RepID=UPI001B43F515|nr:F390 synthetase-related protein [Rhodoferax sp.]MBP9907080.1 adenylate synthase [Rhodoferax sp.]
MSRWHRLGDAWGFLCAFVRARWGYRFKDRAGLLRWQQQKLRRYLTHDLAHMGYYKDLNRSDLTLLPVVDKTLMLAAFDQFNRPGLVLDQVLAVATQAERERDFKPTLPAGITAGLSSGTSGQRGVFLANERERAIWAGTVLARVLSSQALRQFLNPVASPLRVALLLRANSNLYTTVHSWRLHFYFGDLLAPTTNHVAMLNDLQPHILVAPASVLHTLADAQDAGALSIAPHQVISVAEVLEPDDAQGIALTWGRRPDQIYQCTEGFLASTCHQGRLHLNEELVHFEMDWLDESRTRFMPVITDFTRQTQAFVRYRLDDILRADPRPCSCGRVGLGISAIEGRQDDVLWLPAQGKGVEQAVFPDLVRRAMALAQTQTGLAKPRFSDYRLVQRDGNWEIRLNGAITPDEANAAVEHEIQSLCLATGLVAPTMIFVPWVDDTPGAKRRRIRCQRQPQLDRDAA